MSKHKTKRLKIVVYGSAGVGKTCLLQRYCKDKFGPQEATIGADFYSKRCLYNGENFDLILWDTAGLERFGSLPSGFFRGVKGGVLVYDITNRRSFDDLRGWLRLFQEKKEESGPEPVHLIVGNKCDLDNREVSVEEGTLFARKHRAIFLETSAKTNLGVTAAFEDLVGTMMQNPHLWKNDNEPDTVRVGPQSPGTQKESKCSSCSGRWKLW